MKVEVNKPSEPIQGTKVGNQGPAEMESGRK